jgi:hypothetical protein
VELYSLVIPLETGSTFCGAANNMSVLTVDHTNYGVGEVSLRISIRRFYGNMALGILHKSIS